MIDPSTLDTITRKLANIAALQTPQQRRRVWFMSHHHYIPVCDVDTTDAMNRKVSVMANASRVLNLARNMDVEVIVHGHQHQPFLSQLSRWMGMTESVKFRPLLLIGAGSAGAKREHLGPIAQNHYFLLILQKGRLIIRSRKFGEEGLSFTPTKTSCFPSRSTPVETQIFFLVAAELLAHRRQHAVRRVGVATPIRNLPNSAALMTGTGTPSSTAAATVHRPSPANPRRGLHQPPRLSNLSPTFGAGIVSTCYAQPAVTRSINPSINNE